MIPLRVQFSLTTPWCPTQQGLHLDGLIAWAMTQEADHHGRTYTHEEILADLPFAQYQGEFGTVWQASMVLPAEVLGSERRYMTSKTAERALMERSLAGQIEGRPINKVDTVRGPFKNDALWYTIQDVPRCDAWCVGDPDRIAGLLDYITHLGRRGRLDHGRVEHVEMHEDAEALERWKLRYMPEPVVGYAPVIARLTPPYWMGEGTTTVWRPIA